MSGGSKKAGVGSKKGSGGSKKASGGSKKTNGGSKKASVGSQTGMGSQLQQNMVMSQAPHASQTSVVVGTQASSASTRVRPLPLLLQDSTSKRTTTSVNRFNSP